jgi:signal transduction histidine kinase
MKLTTSLLLIADPTPDRENLASFLEKYGYQIAQYDFTSAAEALLKRRDFALVLVLITAQTEERAFVRASRTAHAWRLPVVVTSLLDSSFEPARWLRLGADDCLLEPLNANLLDIRVQTWQEKRENQRLDGFVGFWAHELLTPMLSVRAFSDLLLKQEFGPLNERQIQWLQTAYRNADFGVLLVNTMRDMAQIESGSLLLNVEPVALTNLAHDVINSFNPAIEAAEHKIAFQMLNDLTSARGDHLRLQHVLESLVDNAIRYTPKGGQITLFGLQEDHVIHVAVRDTGTGIAMEDQEFVFTRYWRSHTNPKVLEHRGMGVSLYIAKSIIELHGGRMWFESTPHEGSTFHFTVPQAEPRDDHK